VVEAFLNVDKFSGMKPAKLLASMGPCIRMRGGFRARECLLCPQNRDVLLKDLTHNIAAWRQRKAGEAAKERRMAEERKAENARIEVVVRAHHARTAAGEISGPFGSWSHTPLGDKSTLTATAGKYAGTVCSFDGINLSTTKMR
jgi:hypothetical protein